MVNLSEVELFNFWFSDQNEKKKKEKAWANIKEVLGDLSQKNKLKYQLGQYKNLQ